MDADVYLSGTDTQLPQKYHGWQGKQKACRLGRRFQSVADQGAITIMCNKIGTLRCEMEKSMIE